MSTSSSARRSPFWRSDRFVALAIVTVVSALHLPTGAIRAFQQRSHDAASTARERQPSDRIAVIAMDVGPAGADRPAGSPAAPRYDAAPTAVNRSAAPFEKAEVIGRSPGPCAGWETGRREDVGP